MVGVVKRYLVTDELPRILTLCLRQANSSTSKDLKSEVAAGLPLLHAMWTYMADQVMYVHCTNSNANVFAISNANVNAMFVLIPMPMPMPMTNVKCQMSMRRYQAEEAANARKAALPEGAEPVNEDETEEGAAALEYVEMAEQVASGVTTLLQAVGDSANNSTVSQDRKPVTSASFLVRDGA